MRSRRARSNKSNAIFSTNRRSREIGNHINLPNLNGKKKEFNLNFKQVLHHARQFIRASEQLIEIIPSPNDEIPTLVMKGLSLADRAYSYFYGQEDEIGEYMSRFEVEKKNSLNFVKLYFQSLKDPSHIIKHNTVGSDCVCTTVTIPDNGTLYFFEDTYEGRKDSWFGNFYYTPGFDFRKLLSVLWDRYDNRIYVALDPKDPGWQKSSTFSEFAYPSNNMYGSNIERLESLQKKNAAYREDNITRSYLFIGEPGTGKSTFAIRLAQAGERIIKFDAKTLESLNAEHMEFFIENLGPEYIIVDDIDKIIFSVGNATLLYILESIKEKFPHITVVLTANELNKMDPALLRPGRVDEILEFECSNEDRQAILEGYLNDFNQELTKKQIKQAVEATDYLSGAYVREFAIQLIRTPFEEVLENFNRRRRLLSLEPEEGEEEPSKKRKKRKRKKNKKNKKGSAKLMAVPTPSNKKNKKNKEFSKMDRGDIKMSGD